MFACIHAPEYDANDAALLECAQVFSPRVEQTGGGTVVLDISGLDQLFGTAHDIANAIARRASALGIQVNIAIASNPDAAIHAARGFSGVSILPQGDEAKYLARLPLELLSAPAEMDETLARWGIRTFGDLAALPPLGITERLGPDGVRFQQLARGEWERPLEPATEPLRFEEEMELEYPVALLEPLSFVLAQLLNQLCGRLESRALATHELHLRLKLENQTAHARDIRLPVPMRDSKLFLKLLQLDLQSHPPQAPVIHVSLDAKPVKPRVAQNGLFMPVSPEPEKLELTLARIVALVGEEHVGSPELLDTHRPGAFRMKRFGEPSLHVAAQNGGGLALRIFRPPRSVNVHMDGGRPARLSAPGIHGKVISCAGPWRTSGDWWTTDPWARDEWDVGLEQDAVYRIYRQHIDGRWFIEGFYD